MTSPAPVADVSAPFLSPIKESSLPSFVQNRKPKNRPVAGLQYWKEWNADDFVGKYHLSRFKNKDLPIPGTAVTVEKEHERRKAADIQRMEDGLAERAKNRDRKVHVKALCAEERIKVEMQTVIGDPIEKSEEILREREELNKDVRKYADTPKQIARFFKNISQNKYNYVGFAVTTGYRAVSAQDPVTGDTPLQIAIRKGFVETVEELLKYKADPNCRNNLGNCAIHEAWFFWRTHWNRTKEEREEQERKTCEILYKILSYGGYVDAVDQQGQTALHIACRLGPIRAVTMLLGFRADHTIRTDAGKGQSPKEIAEAFGKTEIAQLLEVWDTIRHRMVHVDFVILWRKFLSDSEAIISNNKTAETILFEIDMQLGLGTLDRAGKTETQIDDTLLRQAYKGMRETAKVPRPWERGWSDFVRDCESRGLVDLRTQLEESLGLEPSVQKKKPPPKKKSLIEDEDASTSKRTGGLELNLAEQQSLRLPDRRRPQPRPRTVMSSRVNTATSSPTGGTGLDGFERTTPISRASSRSTSRSPSPSAFHSPSQFSPLQFRARDDFAEGSIPSAFSSPGFIVELESPKGDDADTMEGTGVGSGAWLERMMTPPPRDSPPVAELASSPAERPMSQVQQRRLNSARVVSLDAKFLPFTKRPATSSALFLPLRTANAPLLGTEEEKSVLRGITSQGVEYELAAKNRMKDIRARLGFESKPAAISPMGAYCDPEDATSTNERDRLYSRMVVKPMTDLEAAEAAVIAAAAENSKRVAVQALKQEKVDMVNNRRRLFVEPANLPPLRKKTAVQIMAQERMEKENEERLKKQGLLGDRASAARAEFEAQILANSTGDSMDDDSSAINSMASERRRKLKAHQRGAFFLKKKVVKYGVNRITSTHNSKGPIEKPWSTVSGRYATLPYDRTA